MSTFGTEINRPAGWEQALNISQVIRGDSPLIPRGYEIIRSPIKQFSTLVATNIAAPVPPRYRLGAFMRQNINLPFGGSYGCELNSLFCPVNKFKVHLLPGFNDGYELEFAVPKYFERVAIGLWEYTDPLETIQDQEGRFERDRLYAAIAALQNSVDSILFSSGTP